LLSIFVNVAKVHYICAQFAIIFILVTKCGLIGLCFRSFAHKDYLFLLRFCAICIKTCTVWYEFVVQ